MTKTYLHTMPVRIWHWANVLCFLALIVTGAQIRYRGILELMAFQTAVAVHNFCGGLLIVTFLFWALYYAATGKIKVYLPDVLHLVDYVTAAVKQARYYGYGIFAGEKNPHHATMDHKFNPMQQVSYFGIMFFMMPAQIVTGVLLWDLDRFASFIDLAGGIKIVSGLHMLLTFIFTAFLFVHVYLTTLGLTPMEHIKAMFTGYEEEASSEEQAAGSR